jgi:hypothetical protein
LPIPELPAITIPLLDVTGMLLMKVVDGEFGGELEEEQLEKALEIGELRRLLPVELTPSGTRLWARSMEQGRILEATRRSW